MLKAKLITGEVIELVKDCECITHSGPHWLHLDDLDRVKATELLNAGAYAAHISLSLERLTRKEYEMVSRGIEEIIRT